MPKRASLILYLIALGGCAAGPDYRAPSVHAGRGWAEPAAVSGPIENVSRWWMTFDDPTLNRLIEQARSNNRSLREAVARVEQARALLDATAGGRYPSADLTGSVTERRQSENGSLPIGRIPGLERDQTIFETGFDAAWEIDFFGRTRRSIEAAEARLGEAWAQGQAAQLTVTAEVARTYLSLRALQRERAAQESAVSLSRRTAELVRRQFELGEVVEAQVAQVDAELASLEAQLPMLDAEIRSMALALGVLLGGLPEAELALVKERTAYATLSPLPVGERADVLRRRPDVRIAERRLAAATAEIGVAAAELFPRLSIGARGSFQSLEASELFDSGSQTWNVVPLITWRVFDGGRIRAQVRASEARAKAAAFAYEETVLAALLEAERALSRYHYGLMAVEQQRIAVAAAQRNHELAEIRYRAGATTLLELLDAERGLRNAQTAYARVHRGAETDLVALFKALGGGWDPAPQAVRNEQGKKRGKGKPRLKVGIQTPVAIAVEVKAPKGFGRTRLRRISDVTAADVIPFVQDWSDGAACFGPTGRGPAISCRSTAGIGMIATSCRTLTVAHVPLPGAIAWRPCSSAGCWERITGGTATPARLLPRRIYLSLQPTHARLACSSIGCSSRR